MAPVLLDAAGESGPALAAAVAVVLRRLDALGLEQAVLLGEGFSATIALQLAALHPERVDQLVLCAPLGYISPLSGGRHTPMSLGEAVRRLYSANPSRTSEALEVLVGNAVGPAKDIAESFVAGCADPGVRQAAAVLADWLDTGEFDLAARPEGDAIRKVDHQVSLVWGRDDLWAPLDSAFYLTRRLRNVRLRVFPHCGHLVSLESGPRVERYRRSILAGAASPAVGVGVRA